MALSTQFVECLFAAFEAWSHAARGKLTITNLACKHVAHQFMLQHQIVFSNALVNGLRRAVQSTARSRPVWIQSKRVQKHRDAAASFRGNFISRKAAADRASRHHHDKGQTLKDAHRAWHSAGEDERQIPRPQAGALTSSEAKALRLKTMLDSYSDDAVSMGATSSPWNLGDTTAPLSGLGMTRIASAGLDQQAEAWTERTASLVEGTGEVIPPQSTASCLQCYSACTSSTDILAFCDSFLADVRLVVAPWGTAASRRKYNPTPLIKIMSACKQHELFIQVANWRCIRGSGIEFDGFVLVLIPVDAGGQSLGELEMPDSGIILDTDIALRVGSLSTCPWEFYNCTTTVDGAFHHVVNGIVRIDVQEVREQHEQAMAAKRAMKLLAESKLPWSKRLLSKRQRPQRQFPRLRPPVGRRVVEPEDDDGDAGGVDEEVSTDTDGDHELLEAWQEAQAEQEDRGQGNAAEDAAAPAHAVSVWEDCRDDKGYVFETDVSAPLGRVAVQRQGKPSESAHVQCWVHPNCGKWVTMKHVPDKNDLVRWVLAANDEKYIPAPGCDRSAAELHMRDFYTITHYQR